MRTLRSGLGISMAVAAGLAVMMLVVGLAVGTFALGPALSPPRVETVTVTREVLVTFRQILTQPVTNTKMLTVVVTKTTTNMTAFQIIIKRMLNKLSEDIDKTKDFEKLNALANLIEAVENVKGVTDLKDQHDAICADRVINSVKNMTDVYNALLSVCERYREALRETTVESFVELINSMMELINAVVTDP